jgi:hypothetical protein
MYPFKCRQECPSLPLCFSTEKGLENVKYVSNLPKIELATFMFGQNRDQYSLYNTMYCTVLYNRAHWTTRRTVQHGALNNTVQCTTAHCTSCRTVQHGALYITAHCRRTVQHVHCKPRRTVQYGALYNTAQCTTYNAVQHVGALNTVQFLEYSTALGMMVTVYVHGRVILGAGRRATLDG